MKKRQGDWRKKVFCLLLGLMMVFSQMGFAFAETGLDLSGEPQPSQNEEPQTGGETQDTEQPQTPEQPQEAEAPAEEPQQPTPARTADELLNAANQLAEANLPQILADARMRMVYEGKQAMKMADAFAFTADAEAEGGGTWAWTSYTPEGSEEAVSCDTLSYYTIEDPADWEALTACVNAGNTLAGKTVVLANDVDFSTLKDTDGEQKALTPVGNVRKELQGKKTVYINVPFSGIFDGQSHALQNILFDNEKANYDEIDVALFGCIENAEIKDLTVSGKVNITAHEDKSSNYGGIAGIVGLLEGKSTLKHVINYCDVSATSGSHSTAGIVNTVGKTGTMLMENCANYGAVHSDNTYSTVAGLLQYVASGNANQNKIINSFNEGEVTGVDRNSTASTTAYEIASTFGDKFSEIRGCYGTGKNALFQGRYSSLNYDKRSLITCAENSSEAASDYVTYVPQEQFHSWRTVWLLNQGSTAPSYTLKDGKLQWAEADSPIIYQVALAPYTYGQDTNPITASAEATALGEGTAQDYYVTDGTELKVKLQGTKEQYPIYTVTELANGDRGAGQSRVEANEKKEAVLEMTLKVEGKNITLQYGSLAEYEQEANTLWYSDQKSEFTLQTPGELRGFAQLVNGGNDFSGRTVKLGKDIDVSKDEIWTPIAAKKAAPLKGTFDGAGKKITYQIGECSKTDMALFGYLDGAELKNLTAAGENRSIANSKVGTAGLCISATNSRITDCVNEVRVITANSNSAAVGGILASATNSVIENCVNKAEITGKAIAAGIVGDTSGNTAGKCTYIRGCRNEGSITGSKTGGIVGNYASSGVMTEPVVENCRNLGAVTASGMNVGGIAGSFTGWMRNCENTAEIDGNGKSVIGGIVGYLQAATNAEIRIEKCRNSGDVYGTPIAGGIAGKTDSKKTSKIQIVNCENTGNVQTKKTGGATGASNGGIIGESSFPTLAAQTGAALYVQDCISYAEENLQLHAVGKLYSNANNLKSNPTRKYEAVYALAEEGEDLVYDGSEPLAVNADSFRKSTMTIKLNKAGNENFWGYDAKAKYPLFGKFAEYPIMELTIKPFTEADAEKYQIELVSDGKSLTLDGSGNEKSTEMTRDFKAVLNIQDKNDASKSAKVMLITGGQVGSLQDAKDVPIRAQTQNILAVYGDEANYENFVFTDWYDDAAEEAVIYTAGQLKGFAQLVNEGKTFAGKTVKLAKDIDLSALCGVEIGSWQPIGLENFFSGTFDGQGHSIRGLYIDLQDLQSGDAAGLFGKTSDAEIRDLTIRGSRICDTGETPNAKVSVGMLLGSSQMNLTVSKIKIAEDCSVQAAASCVGGIIGLVSTVGRTGPTTLQQDAKISEVENHADVKLLAGGKRKSLTSPRFGGKSVEVTSAGGIIGHVTNGSDSWYGPREGELRLAVNSGNITNEAVTEDTTKPYYNCAGGLIGTAHSNVGNASGGGATSCALPVSLCYNTGDVTAKEANGRAAGITGLRVGYKSTDLTTGAYNSASQIGNCFSTGKTEGETAAAISTAFVLQADNEANYYVDHFAEGVSIQDAKYAKKVSEEAVTDGSLAYILDKGDLAGKRTAFFDQGAQNPVFSTGSTVYKLSVHTVGLDDIEGLQEAITLPFADQLTQMDVSCDAKLLTGYFAKKPAEEYPITFQVNTPEGYALSDVSGSGILEGSLKIKDKEIKEKETGKIDLTSTVTLTVSAGADLNLYLNFIKMPSDYGTEMKVVLNGNAGEEKLWTLLPLITPPKKAEEISFTYQNGDRLSEETLNKQIAKQVLNDPISRKGYRFTGWYTDRECLQPFAYTKILSGYDTEEHPLTLYAGWEKIDTVTITLNGNGDEKDPALFDERLYEGEAIDDQSVYAFDAETGSKAEIPAAKEPTRDGYTFCGWFYDAGSHLKFGADTFTSDLTLYAGWLAEDECMLTFDADGGYFNVDGQKSAEYLVKVKKNAENLAIAGLGVPKAQHDMVQGRGYQFLGWALDGSDEVLDSIPAVSADMKLIAKWKASGSETADPVKNFEDFIKNQPRNDQGEFDEIVISDYETLKALAAYVNAGNDCKGRTFVLGSDLTLGSDWTGIGNNTTNPFGGTLNGNGHTITYDDAKAPLFGTVSGRVSDIAVAGSGKINGGIADTLLGGTIENCRVRSGSSFVGDDIAGGIVGTISTANASIPGGTVSGCTIEDGVSITGGSYVGGIAGRVIGQDDKGSATISNCEVGAATIKGAGCTTNPANGGGVGGMGGILGYGAGNISDCMSDALIEASKEGAYGIGGIVGAKGTTQGKLRVERCGFTGDIKAENADSVGGILGSNQDAQPNGAVLKDVYADGTLDLGANSGDGVGGIMGSTPFNFAGGKTSSIENAYWNGKLTNPNPSFDPIAGNTCTTVSNAYYSDADGYESGREGAKGMPDYAFVSGEIAYELDKDHSPRGTWTQGETGPIFNKDGEAGIIFKVEVDRKQEIEWPDGTKAEITTTVSSELSEKAGLSECDTVFVKNGQKVKTTVVGIPDAKVVENPDGSKTTTSYDVKIKDKNGDQLLYDSTNPTADITVSSDLAASGAGGSSTTTAGGSSGSGGGTGGGEGTGDKPGDGDGDGDGDGQGDGNKPGDGQGGQQGDGTGQTGGKGDKPNGGKGTGTDVTPSVTPKPAAAVPTEQPVPQEIADDPAPSQASDDNDHEQIDQPESGGQSQGGGEQGEIQPESKIYKLIKSVTDTVRENPAASAAILIAVIGIIAFGAWNRKRKEDHSAKK